MSRRIVTDTGPLIHLAQADVLQLLELLGEICLPEVVLTELERGSPDTSELAFTVEHVEYDDSMYPHLEPGETAALVLCANWDGVLLTDDLDARTTAQDEDIEVHGSVGVVLYAYGHGKLFRSSRKTRTSSTQTGYESVFI